jgi:hypothetical protein
MMDFQIAAILMLISYLMIGYLWISAEIRANQYKEQVKQAINIAVKAHKDTKKAQSIATQYRNKLDECIAGWEKSLK